MWREHVPVEGPMLWGSRTSEETRRDYALRAETLTIKDRPWGIDSEPGERRNIWYKWRHWFRHTASSPANHEQSMFNMFENPVPDELPFTIKVNKNGAINRSWKPEYMDYARAHESHVDRILNENKFPGMLWEVIEENCNIHLTPDVAEKSKYDIERGCELLDLVLDDQHYIEEKQSKYGNCVICRRIGIVGEPCTLHKGDILGRNTEGIAPRDPRGRIYSIQPCGTGRAQGYVCRFITQNGNKVINPWIIELQTEKYLPMTDENLDKVQIETNGSNSNIKWEPKWFEPLQDCSTFRQDVLIFHICRGSDEKKLSIALNNVINEVELHQDFRELKKEWNMFFRSTLEREKDLRTVLRGLPDSVTTTDWESEWWSMGGCTEEDLKRRKEYNRPVTYEHWQQALINIVNEAVQAKRSQEGRERNP